MFILIFLSGIILGLLLATLTLWIIKSKCPSCKKLKPLKEIILFDWKDRTISGKPCHHCQRPKPQVSLEL